MDSKRCWWCGLGLPRYTLFAVPFRIGFITGQHRSAGCHNAHACTTTWTEQVWLVLELLVDIVFIFDCVFCAFTAYIDPETSVSKGSLACARTRRPPSVTLFLPVNPYRRAFHDE